MATEHVCIPECREDAHIANSYHMMGAMADSGWSELTTDEKLDALYLAVNDTRGKLNQILVIAQDVREKVGPLVESLKDHPMVKMLTGGK